MMNCLIMGTKTSLIAAAVLLVSCNNNERTSITLKDFSVTPPMVTSMPGFKGVQFYSLISGADRLPNSPSFRYGAEPAGAGLMKDPSGDGYIMITSHKELSAVSRVYLDKTFTPVKGEYIVDGNSSEMHLSAATLATPEEHGFQAPVFLATGAMGTESMVHAINPVGLVSDRQRCDRTLKAMGRAGTKNAVPLPKDAFPGKTVIMIGEDQSTDASDSASGQLAMYVSNIPGDLQSGDLYALKCMDSNQAATDMVKGSTYNVEFVKLPDIRDRSASEFNTLANGLKAIRFSGIADIDYRKGGADNGREIYFSVKGQFTPGQGITNGRIYKLIMKAGDLTKGTLELIAGGDSATGITDPGNICATENFIYIQQDADMWQLKLSGNECKPFITMNRQSLALHTRYDQAGAPAVNSWEFGTMHDVSGITGIPNTFLLNMRPHTEQSSDYMNADGSAPGKTAEGGQAIILSGVEK